MAQRLRLPRSWYLQRHPVIPKHRIRHTLHIDAFHVASSLSRGSKAPARPSNLGFQAQKRIFQYESTRMCPKTRLNRLHDLKCV